MQVKSRKYPSIECGDIYFLYRPAVGVDEAHGFKDVRRLHILLKPWGTRIYRPIIVAAKVALPRRSASSSMPPSTRWAISALPIWRCRSRPSACGVPPAGKSSACAAARCSNPTCKYIRVLLSSLCAEGVTHSVKNSTKIESISPLEHFSFSRFSLPHGDEQTYCCCNPGAR
jgi:hypothetical protein